MRIFGKQIIGLRSSGITLIETIIALAILTTAAVSMAVTAIFAYTSYDKISARLVALGLSREGIEVVRSIRDTNWLPGPPGSGRNGLDFCGGGNPNQQYYIGTEEYCYQEWLNNMPNQCFTAAGCQAVFAPLQTDPWTLQAVGYALYKQADNSYSPSVNSSTPLFYRKIRLISTVPSGGQNPGYTNDHPELHVRSIVAWLGRGCPTPTGNDPENAGEGCKIIMEDVLTNWKDY